MSISYEQMVELIRMDVVDSINEIGVERTANEYGVEFVAEEAKQLIDRCVAAELTRCYA